MKKLYYKIKNWIKSHWEEIKDAVKTFFAFIGEMFIALTFAMGAIVWFFMIFAKIHERLHPEDFEED